MKRLLTATLVPILTGTLLLAAITIGGTLALLTDTDPVGANTFATDTLDPPTSLTATCGATINLNWTATADTYASGHRVLRATASGGPYTQIAEVTPRTTTTYTDSPSAGTYYYVLRGFFQNWESANSNEALGRVGGSSCVTFPAQTVGTAFGTNPTIANNSPAGTDTLLIVTFAGYGGNGPTSVTWNGTEGLTNLIDFTGNGQEVNIWYLINPTSGNHNITSAGGSAGWWTVKTFHGVDQTNPFDSPVNTNTATGGAGNPAVTITTAADGMTTEVASFDEETGTSPNTDPTNGNSVEDSDSWDPVNISKESRGVDSHTDTTGAITVGWTQVDGTAWAIAVADLKPTP